LLLSLAVQFLIAYITRKLLVANGSRVSGSAQGTTTMTRCLNFNFVTIHRTPSVETSPHRMIHGI